MNLPISLTLLRIFFIPLVVVLLLTKGDNMDLWAVGVFLVAAGTDLFDGYLARKRSQVTAVGILLDPIADKLLTSAAFISLVELHLVPAWMVVIIVGRELAVTGLRSIASTEGFALRPSELGKTKMVFQVVAIAVIILQRRYPAIEPLGTVLLWMVVMFAVASALQYFWLFWKQQDLRVKQRAARPLVMVRSLRLNKQVCCGWRDRRSRRVSRGIDLPRSKKLPGLCESRPERS
jgi:CDP-diacylglycerol--glycerol-3-phosphate 3-phosphatidyltransferase